MKNKLRLILIPEYIEKFSCITEKCEDICCSGFEVYIDRKSYQKYHRLKNPELKPMLDKYITRKRSNSSELNYARIKMGKNRACPFLNENKLCNLQLNLGEKYLSNICKFYPRTLIKINNILEIAGTISCPEIARLVLFNPSKMVFNQIMIREDSSLVQAEVLATKLILSPEDQEHFYKIRTFIIEILQNREYQLWERMIILGSFFENLQEYFKQGLIEETTKLIKNYSRELSIGNIKNSLANIPTQTTIQMILLKLLLDVRFQQGITNPRYLQCFQELLQGIDYISEVSEEKSSQLYEKAYLKYYRPYMSEKEYILENYLVNYVFKQALPLGNATILDEYIMLAIHFALIKMHLIGMAAFHQELNDELVLKLIQSFAKSIEHNKVYLERVRELLKASRLTTISHMAILIKN